MTREEALDTLIAREEITQAMARYARGIDRRDEELVQSAYHEDSFDEHGFGLTGTGWELAANVRRDAEGFPDEWKQSTHFLGQHMIDVDGDRATSEVYFLSYTRQTGPESSEWDQTVCGRYLDYWERRGGEFKIARRTVVYDWVRCDQVVADWPGPDHAVPKMCWGAGPMDTSRNVNGTPDGEDPSYDLLRLPEKV